jgi:hypothetical protein
MSISATTDFVELLQQITSINTLLLNDLAIPTASTNGTFSHISELTDIIYIQGSVRLVDGGVLRALFYQFTYCLNNCCSTVTSEVN